MVKGPSFLSLLSCPRCQVSESLACSGWKRRLGWNLGQHRQDTALWQHVQRCSPQVHQQVHHQVHLIFYALGSSPRCAGVSCYLWHAIPLPIKTSSGSIFFKFEKFQALQNPLECFLRRTLLWVWISSSIFLVHLSGYDGFPFPWFNIVWFEFQYLKLV